ncbi:hypothetical protein DV735_g5006, partial [Chaetothyriales sp. CBS 134920]
MVKLYKELSSCRPSAVSDAYILNILPLFNDTLAVLSSADEILVLNPQVLSSSPPSPIAEPGKGLACCAVDETARLIFAGGTDNLVSVFDIRTGHRSASFPIGKSVTALASRGNDVAVGTELKQHQADLSIWDVRQQKIRWQNNENNDDITALNFHPSKSHILLSGGDDGLVSLFDTAVQEEDDILVQAFNHGPIHKAGFVDHSAIYALSSDQNLAIHPVFEDQRETEPGPVLLGDMRPLVGPSSLSRLLLYLILSVLSRPRVKSQVDLINMKGGLEPDLQNKTVLQNAHGGEIVRTLYIDTASGNTIFSGGEDGCVKAWHPADVPPQQGLSAANSNIDKKFKKHSRPGKRNSLDARYTPY